MIGKLTFGKVGHGASILALAISVCSLLYPGLEPYHVLFITIAVLAGLWIAYSLFKRIRAARDLRDRRTVAPMVLLIGGSEFTGGMQAIEKNVRLLHQPYIQFKEVTVDGKDHWQELSKAVASADAVILMPDFTARSHPEVYRLLVSECEDLPLAIARYYPQDYKPERARDFQILPFDSPDGIVEYSSEFLLKRAVDRGRFLQARLRLLYGIVFGASACFLTSLFFGLLGRQDVALFRKTLITSSTIQQEAASMLADFRSSVSKEELSEPAKARIRKLLTDWTKIQAEEINRISGNSEPIRVYLYALSLDGKALQPIATHGAAAYPISATDSIAGCALQRKLAVYWRGDEDETDEIMAWTLRGVQIGKFDKVQKHLLFDTGHCEFDNEHKGDAKKQILCMPIAADDSMIAARVPGVACVLTDEPAEFMTEEWFRQYLVKQLFALGALDPQRLLSPTVLDAHSAHGGNR